MQFDGEIRLSFVRCGNRTVAHDLYRRGNSRISANVGGEGEVPYYFLISTGGGFVEGERYRQELLLAEKTHAILTTQAPNYIYKCEHGHITTQQVVIHAETGSFLEYYVDETIPYASARFRQMTEVYLGSGARMIMTDGMTAGWAPDGTPFQYRDIGIQTRVFREKKIILNDFLLVNPEENDMNGIGFFEKSTNYNSVLIVDEEINEQAIRRMRDHLQINGLASRWAVSHLEKGGAILRVLGNSLDENRRASWCFVQYYREEFCRMKPFQMRKNQGI